MMTFTTGLSLRVLVTGKGMLSGAGNRIGGSVDVGNRKRSLGVWLIG